MLQGQWTNNQPHQLDAVQSVVEVLSAGTFAQQSTAGGVSGTINPRWLITKKDFYRAVERQHDCHWSEHEKAVKPRQIFDIEMETGTGKTYTYARTMCELSVRFGLTKFVILVPTLAIKSNTLGFFNSPSVQQHFLDEFGRSVSMNVVERRTANCSDPLSPFEPPEPVKHFIEADTTKSRTIEILLINAGMLNSPTFADVFSCEYDTGGLMPLAEGIGQTRPVVIIDEPHRFPVYKASWKNIERLNPLMMIRFGATFKRQYFNLLYRLDNKTSQQCGLVKTVKTIDVSSDENLWSKLLLVKTIVPDELSQWQPSRLIDDGLAYAISQPVAIFYYFEFGCRWRIRTDEESLSEIHSAFDSVGIDTINQHGVIFTNGLFLPIGQSVNPYQLDDTDTYEDQVIQRVIKSHFELERSLMTSKPAIKPFTVFFINDIASYRPTERRYDTLPAKIDRWITEQASQQLETSTDAVYRERLKAVLANPMQAHGGYFAQDRKSNDPLISQQMDEILNDKDRLLSPDNPRRFIFAKWALNEGWDNPNVFQLCKLRKSGSLAGEIQELGRGVRLPVDENGKRQTKGQFEVRYFIDRSTHSYVSKRGKPGDMEGETTLPSSSPAPYGTDSSDSIE
jgi:type III restriction enzyme